MARKAYALRMDPKGKYLERYQQHFREPDLMRFDMQHEEWLFGSTWTETVLAAIDEKMGISESMVEEVRS